MSLPPSLYTLEEGALSKAPMLQHFFSHQLVASLCGWSEAHYRWYRPSRSNSDILPKITGLPPQSAISRYSYYTGVYHLSFSLQVHQLTID